MADVLAGRESDVDVGRGRGDDRATPQGQRETNLLREYERDDVTGSRLNRRSLLASLAGVGLAGFAPSSARGGASGAIPSVAEGDDRLWTRDGLATPLSAVTVDGTLVTQVGRPGPLVARDPRSGEVQWSFDEGTRWYGTDGGLFGAGVDDGFVALSPADGSVDWRASVDGTVTDWAVDGERAYLLVRDGRLVAASTDDGSTQWTVEVDTEFRDLTVAGEGLVMPGRQTVTEGSRGVPRLVGIDAADGTVRWQQDPVADANVRWRLAGDAVYLSAAPGSVRAREVPDGTERWRHESDRTDLVTIVHVDEERLYLYEWGVGVTALDVATGQVDWQRSVPVPDADNRRRSFATLDGDAGVLYLATADENLLALDAATGERHWRETVDVQEDGATGAFYEGRAGLYATFGRPVDGGVEETLLRLDGGGDGPAWRRTVEGAVDDVHHPSEGNLVLEMADTLEHRHVDAGTGEQRWRQPGLTTVSSARPETGGLVYGAEFGDGDTVEMVARPVEADWTWRTSYDVAGGGDDVAFALVDETLAVWHVRTGVMHAFDGDLPAVPAFDVSEEEPDPGQAVTFDASPTVDPEGETASLAYQWDFDDGSTATGRTVEHAFGSEGWYEVTLAVDDGDESSVTNAVAVGGVSEPTSPDWVAYLGAAAGGLGLAGFWAWWTRDGEGD